MRDVNNPGLEQIVPDETRYEIDLILACSKGSLNENDRDTIAHILKNELNWDYFYRQAERHLLIPLIFHNLMNTAPEHVPEEILRQMNKVYLHSMTRSMIQTRQLLEVIQLFAEHEIPVIAYKGVALSQKIYRDIGLRISFDIDILVRQQDAILARDLLVLRGYHPLVSLTPEQDKKFVHLRCEHGLVHPHREMIDIHWQFIPWYYLHPFEETDIWSGLRGISLEGKEISTLSAEMLIIALCIHGAKHQWKELKQVCDIAGIIASEKDINWELILKIAREKRIERILFLGLRLGEVFMNAELPQTVSRVVRGDPGVQRLVSSSIDTMFRGEQSQVGDIQDVQYWLSVRESLWDKFRVVSLLVFTPNHDDWAYISLPWILSPLYYIIRPIRLAFEYGVKG
ncbi:hypothetical protein ASZ90_016764 [hydrocarbon metagenome]|jgi:hypothetical protein|uniref:Nucleotidyltransferase family protein n=1 Tax=hydrocarbon metagenome TaxID=938273 RepID=A0A0W8EAY7_9ZZZZ